MNWLSGGKKPFNFLYEWVLAVYMAFAVLTPALQVKQYLLNRGDDRMFLRYAIPIL